MSLVSYLIEQNARYVSSIVRTPKLRASRYLTVFPYRAVNETRRVARQGLQYAKEKARGPRRAG